MSLCVLAPKMLLPGWGFLFPWPSYQIYRVGNYKRNRDEQMGEKKIKKTKARQGGERCPLQV
jgi:hypothetical protein